MIWHPLLVGQLVVDVALLFALGVAVINALQVLNAWNPTSTNALQLALELRAERVTLLARSTLYLYVLSCALLLLLITAVLPDLVAGAMCGTGVLQAMHGQGERALLLRTGALILLVAWASAQQLNERDPLAPLTTLSCRLLLLAAPVCLVSMLASSRALMSLDPAEPVHCCAMLFDSVRDSGPQLGQQWSSSVSASVWLSMAGVLSTLLLIGGVFVARYPKRITGLGAAFVSVVTTVWAYVATQALLQVLVAYHYGVMAHRCPWCLFLPEHHLLGYPLLVAMLVALLQSLRMPLLASWGRKSAKLEIESRRQLRIAGVSVAIAVLIFVCVASAPALLWRLRFGVWMG